jgi:hypothetical protein
MLLDSILKLHDKIQNMKLGVHREAEIDELEEASLRRLPLAAGASPPPRRAAGGPEPAGGSVMQEKSSAPEETDRLL